MGATKAKDLSLQSLSSNGTEAVMHFVKMHGLGNDFVMVTDAEIGRLFNQAKNQTKCTNLSVKEFCAALAKTVCDRHFGIGADGLIVAIKLSASTDLTALSELSKLAASYPDASNCDLAWLYINSDGSASDMCGNGLRCLAAFGQNLGWVNANFTVATAVYPVQINPVAADIAGDTALATGLDANFDTVAGAFSSPKTQINSSEVTTRLAGPKYAQADIPLKIGDETINGADFVEQKIAVRGEIVVATCVSMGNPHCVIFDQPACGIDVALDLYAADIEEAQRQGKTVQKFPAALLSLAEDIQNLALFPQGVNVEFVRVASPDQALVFVVERGCGATLACASGAAAVLAAGVKTKRLNKKSYVILPGGKLKASLSLVREQEYIDLTGPAVQVFAGDFAFDASALFEGSCR